MRILCFGNVFKDKFAPVDEPFLNTYGIKKESSTLEFDLDRFIEIWKKASENHQNLKKRIGGSGVNVLMTSARLGHTGAIVGRVGNDKRGEKIQEHLKQLGVTSHLITNDNVTATALCLETSGERTMLIYLGANLGLNGQELVLETLQGYEHYHMEGYAALFEGVIDRFIEIAKSSNASLSLNLPTVDIINNSQTGDRLRAAVPHLKYLFGNKEEIMALTQKETLEEAFGAFEEQQLVAVTDGANGSWIKAAGASQAIHFPAVPVNKVTNKTGAGDIWTGVFLSFILKDKSIEACAEMATQAASEWVQLDLGDQMPERVWDAVREKFEGHTTNPTSLF